MKKQKFRFIPFLALLAIGSLGVPNSAKAFNVTGSFGTIARIRTRSEGFGSNFPIPLSIKVTNNEADKDFFVDNFSIKVFDNDAFLTGNDDTLGDFGGDFALFPGGSPMVNRGGGMFSTVVSLSLPFSLLNRAQDELFEGRFLEISLKDARLGLRDKATLAMSTTGDQCLVASTCTSTPAESTEIPEPLTILGSGLALGFGAYFKKEYSRKQKKAKAKA